MILQCGESFGSRRANAVICISEPIAQGVRKKYGRDVKVIPNGVDFESTRAQGTRAQERTQGTRAQVHKV